MQVLNSIYKVFFHESRKKNSCLSSPLLIGLGIPFVADFSLLMLQADTSHET